MDRGYYTPTIEDFIPGLEYEVKAHALSDQWRKMKPFLEDRIETDFVIKTMRVKPEDIRVKRLCEDDFDALGAKIRGNQYHLNYHIYDDFYPDKRGPQYFVRLDVDYTVPEGIILITKREHTKGLQTLYRGKCKNLSELKRILGILNIPKEIDTTRPPDD